MIKCPKCGTNYSGAERFCPKDGARLGTGESHIPRIPSIPPNTDPLINQIIQGRYKVIEQIGEGGMGVVYVAEHIEIEKKVALKVLRDDFSKRPEVVARFRQEARSASKIGNAHIVDVTDFGQLENGGVFFVMEHLKGKGLSEVIRTEVIEVQRAVHVILQISKALKAAHKLGIVHRDLKPENIFLVENDEQQDFVKILDFGIAKISDRDSEGQRLTKTGMIFGTPEYMSPEQASGKPLDHRVDIYALGCIMFEMFTGVVPYEGETFMAVLTQHMFEPVPRIEEINPETDVNEAIKAVVYKAMAKDKEERYPDMESLAIDLERAMSDSSYIPILGETSGTNFQYHRTMRPRTGDQKAIWTPDIEIGNDIKRKNARKIILAILIIAVIVVGVGAGAYVKGYFTKDKEEKIEKGEKEIVALEREKVEEVTEITEEQKASDNKKEDTEKEIKKKEEGIEKKVTVKVKTDPKGATIFIEEMGQVCSSAPCDIQLEEGEAYEMEARYEGRVARITFTPSSQNRNIELDIPKKAKKKEKRKGKKKGEGKKEKTEISSGTGLKIPDIFIKN